jgi:tetratricopeptide (TPR) repeat protein
MEEALVKDPLSLISHYFLGYLYYFIRKWDLAIEHWKTTLELDPQYHSAHMALSLVYVQKGMIEEGICACDTALRVYRNWSRGWVGLVFALAGRIDAARELLSELQDRARAEYVPSLDFALLHLGLGQIERCFDRLEKTVDEHDEKIFVFLPDVPLDPLRSIPFCDPHITPALPAGKSKAYAKLTNSSFGAAIISQEVS